ncbi:MAG: S8 family serine peptidase [Parcubacteria group bacterium]|nr:S8 family serine peptidase [Parcubacteria group bacterium]
MKPLKTFGVCLVGIFLLSQSAFLDLSAYSSYSKVVDSQETQRLVSKLDSQHASGIFLVKTWKGRSLEHFDTFTNFWGRNLLFQELFKPERLKFKDSKVQASIEKTKMSHWYAVSGFDVSEETKIFLKLASDPNVQVVEPDYVASVRRFQPDDPLFPKQWALDNTGQTGGKPGADIKAIKAWEFYKGDPNAVVGIIDSGVDYEQPDLRDNILVNVDDPINGIDDDENGYVDDFYGWNSINDSNKVMDDYGHGTIVIGVPAGRGNNGLGITGINHKAKIGIAKFLDETGSGFNSDAAKSVLYTVSRGWEITNNSWGGGGFSQLLFDAISVANDAGFLFIAAAGNSKSDNDKSPSYPDSYDLPNIISVAATDHNDKLASFTNYGLKTVHVAAPGDNILSTTKIGNCNLCTLDGYAAFSGTSLSGPMVSGAARLLWSYYKSMGKEVDYLFIKNKILLGSDVLESINTKVRSGGRLNLYNLFEPDIVPPSAVNDLTAVQTFYNSVSLEWTAVGDDGLVGNASRYQIRYFKTSTDEFNFDNAIEVLGNPLPQDSGNKIQFKFNNLDPDTNYSVAVRALDNVGNTSSVSNIVTFRTNKLKLIFSDNFDGPNKGWVVAGKSTPTEGALWHLSKRRSFSPDFSYYYGQEFSGNYDTGYWNYGSLESPLISLESAKDPFLEFQSFLRRENNFYSDLAWIQVSKNGGENWIYSYFFDTSDWKKYKIDLSAYAGSKEFKFRFFFNTFDQYGNKQEGWYVDDIFIYSSNGT